MALAMVFSVQQGEHGPLVVYKLEIPANAAAAPPLRDGGRLDEPLYVIPSRAPRVLGRVTVTPTTPGAPKPLPAGGVSVLDIIEGLTPAAPRRVEPAPAREADGEAVTLDRVNADISWRRETAETLRSLPFSPRF